MAPHVIYAATQERGGVHEAHTVPSTCTGSTPGGEWFKKRVDIPQAPYMEPAQREVIEDGSLVRAAMEAFMAVVWG